MDLLGGEPVELGGGPQKPRGKGRGHPLLPVRAVFSGIWLRVRLCSFLLGVSERGEIKEDVWVPVSVPLVGRCWGSRGAGRCWPWQAFAGSAGPNIHGSALGLPCPCGPSVTAAVGPGRLSPLGLTPNVPPGLPQLGRTWVGADWQGQGPFGGG